MMLCIHIEDMELFDLHERILCVLEVENSVLLYIHNVDTEMLGLHELILYEFEDYLSL